MVNRQKIIRIEFQEILQWALNVKSTEDALKCRVFKSGIAATNTTHLKQVLTHVYSKDERIEIFKALERTRPECKVCNTEIPWSRWNYQAWPAAWASTCSKECGRHVIRIPKDIIARGQAISIAKKVFFQTEKGKHIAKHVGLKNSNSLKIFYNSDIGKETAKLTGKKISVVHKRDIAAGKWTPGIHNRWTRWNAAIGERKFRSSWEACFWFCNQHLEYEVFRCPYWDKISKKTRTYIGDFWDKNTCTVFEIKPSAIIKKEHVKIKQISEWCNENSINFVLLDEQSILKYLNAETLSLNADAALQYDKSKLKSKIS